MAEQIPSVGGVVHYVLPDGRSAGEHRPAIIVRVWDSPPHSRSYVQLQVFVDGTNDYPDYNGAVWATSVQADFGDTPAPRTWHWPEYVPAAAN
jgi:hypothetical protein